jgi:hypothetical protein
MYGSAPLSLSDTPDLPDTVLDEKIRLGKEALSIIDILTVGENVKFFDRGDVYNIKYGALCAPLFDS